jgi:hypothetical protein
VRFPTESPALACDTLEVSCLDIRDRCAKDHPKVVLLALIGRDDNVAIDGDWQQHWLILDELLGPPA